MGNLSWTSLGMLLKYFLYDFDYFGVPPNSTESW